MDLTEGLATLTFSTVRNGDHTTSKTLSQTFADVVFEARIIQDRFKLLSNIVSGYGLPILYAMLGALAYGMRDLAQRSATRTWTIRAVGRARLRFLLAIIVGTVVGVFTDFSKGLSIPPLAWAFLAGYGVEVFFGFLDLLIQRTADGYSRLTSG